MHISLKIYLFSLFIKTLEKYQIVKLIHHIEAIYLKSITNKWKLTGLFPFSILFTL